VFNVAEPNPTQPQLQWHVKKVSTSNSQVAEAPGIYAIGHQEDVCGLPLQHHVFYVGRSENLRRRLSQHDLRLESNPRVVSYLRANIGRVRIWYAYVASPKQLSELEKHLIQALDPKGNRLKYKSGEVSK
jgi:excinuclease UvrABC nuclease subunit